MSQEGQSARGGRTLGPRFRRPLYPRRALSSRPSDQAPPSIAFPRTPGAWRRAVCWAGQLANSERGGTIGHSEGGETS